MAEISKRVSPYLAAQLRHSARAIIIANGGTARGGAVASEAASVRIELSR